MSGHNVVNLEYKVFKNLLNVSFYFLKFRVSLVVRRREQKSWFVENQSVALPPTPPD